ncbi:uncharacterized protein C2845_PM01G17790 [Panicum miliaceum]|uniref:Uncharacterized protein n=1 Tax=Panicum miliaceum TaxID=4540 RepID=A0A3L6TIV3_PANMI|nr:uncharacterized protein C2845_PM01G17790 [Panicum miliaceum]
MTICVLTLPPLGSLPKPVSPILLIPSKHPIQAGAHTTSSVAAPGKDGGHGCGKPGSKGAAESFAGSTAAGVEEKDNKAVVVESPWRSGGRHPADGEARRRPKFRSLAARPR